MQKAIGLRLLPLGVILTILGSVANLIVVEVARGAGLRIGFAEYCRVGSGS